MGAGLAPGSSRGGLVGGDGASVAGTCARGRARTRQRFVRDRPFKGYLNCLVWLSLPVSFPSSLPPQPAPHLSRRAPSSLSRASRLPGQGFPLLPDLVALPGEAPGSQQGAPARDQVAAREGAAWRSRLTLTRRGSGARGGAGNRCVSPAAGAGSGGPPDWLWDLDMGLPTAFSPQPALEPLRFPTWDPPWHLIILRIFIH